jgi:hypothetical protein
VHQHRLATPGHRQAVQQLVSGRVGQHEAHHLGRVELVGDLDRVRLRQADALGIGAPCRQRGHPDSRSQPRTPRPEFLDDAEELIAGGERGASAPRDTCRRAAGHR